MQKTIGELTPLIQAFQAASNKTATAAQTVSQLAQADPNNWGWVNEQLQGANGNAKQAFMNAAKEQGLDVNQLTAQVQQMFGAK